MDYRRFRKIFDDRGLDILRIITEIRIFYIRFTKKFNKYFHQKGHDLTVDQWRILRWLLVSDKETLSNITKILDDDLGAVCRRVSRMEDNGYIERIEDPADRRQRFIALTKKTKDSQDKFIRLSAKLVRHLFSNFSDEEMKQFIHLLDRLASNLESFEIE